MHQQYIRKCSLSVDGEPQKLNARIQGYACLAKCTDLVLIRELVFSRLKLPYIAVPARRPPSFTLAHFAILNWLANLLAPGPSRLCRPEAMSSPRQPTTSPREPQEHPPTRRRRPHKKSRSGCLECRKRRVKVINFAESSLSPNTADAIL